MNSLVRSLHNQVSSRAVICASAAVISAFALTGPGAAHDGFGDLVEELIPSVVSITVEAERKSRNPLSDRPREFQEFFDRYMPDFKRIVPEGETQLQTVRSVGSGFFISEDGYIVTNAHVVENGTKIKVQLSDLQTFEAEVIGADPNTDIAVLKIDAGDQKMPALRFGDSGEMRVGDHVLAIGNPLGLDFSVSAGIVSGRNRTLTGGYDDFIQTDAAINSGNSGGPLLNMEGEVVGVNTLYLGSGQPRGGSSGIGFAMASAVVENVVGQLKEFGTTRRGWLGISMQTLTADIAEAMGLETADGTLVVSLLEGPAAEAGVEAGDVITELDGNKISGNRDLLKMVADAGSGAEVELTVYRQGEPLMIAVVLGSREEAEGQKILPASRIEEPKEGNALGLELGELDAQKRQLLNLDDGDPGLVVLGVDGSSPAFEKGIRKNDLILQVNVSPVETVEDLSDAVSMAEDAGRESVLLLIQRNGERRYVALPIAS